MRLRGIHTAYQVILASFCVIVVVSNILSAKMVALPFLPLAVPAGLVTYPLTFLLTDLVTEIYGPSRAKLMVYVALGMNLLSLGMIQLGLALPSAQAHPDEAFQAVLGLSGLRIFSSLVAYFAAQMVDIRCYAWLKRVTSPRLLWLRNNGSVFASQIVDTVTIDLIFLWWGLGMAIEEVGKVMLFSYLYKALFSVVCTPLFYLLVFLLRGKRLWLKQKTSGG